MVQQNILAAEYFISADGMTPEIEMSLRYSQDVLEALRKGEKVVWKDLVEEQMTNRAHRERYDAANAANLRPGDVLEFDQMMKPSEGWVLFLDHFFGLRP